MQYLNQTALWFEEKKLKDANFRKMICKNYMKSSWNCLKIMINESDRGWVLHFQSLWICLFSRYQSWTRSICVMKWAFFFDKNGPTLDSILGLATTSVTTPVRYLIGYFIGHKTNCTLQQLWKTLENRFVNQTYDQLDVNHLILTNFFRVVPKFN